MKSIFKKPQDCSLARDCARIPFPEKCRKFCIESVLRVATREEKQLVLGLDAELANRIFSIYQKSEVDSSDKLFAALSEEQTQQLFERFDRITQYQLNYFKKARRERDRIISELRKLDLDSKAPEDPDEL
jgi:hypothetical protein